MTHVKLNRSAAEPSRGVIIEVRRAQNVVTGVSSYDGTWVHWHKSGTGPPATLLHGASGNKSSWIMLSEYLGDEFTLYADDRRGRGRSDVGEPYAFERDVEDVGAVVDAIGEPAHLIGHSFGAVLALAATQAGTPARTLVLIEPPLRAKLHLDVAQLADDCADRIAANDPDGCLSLFYTAIDEQRSLQLMSQATAGLEPIASRRAHDPA